MQNKARSPEFSDEEKNLIKDEIHMLLTKSIIKEACHEEKNVFKQFSCLINVMAASGQYLA